MARNKAVALPEAMSCLANEKWDLNELEHVHAFGIYGYSVPHRSGFGTL